MQALNEFASLLDFKFYLISFNLKMLVTIKKMFTKILEAKFLI